jgi:hypothetical protein
MERGDGRRAVRFQISGGVSMKKLISILVVFAVLASAVIAQEGSWSVSGGGEIGTTLNFITRDGDGDPQPWIGGTAYHDPDWYDQHFGKLSADYSNGDISAGLDFGLNSKINARVKYDNGDLTFVAETELFDGLFAGDFDKVGRLWGSYKFLDGTIALTVAAKSADTNYWISNEVVGNVFDSAKVIGYGIGWGFASVDGHNYLAADFNLSSLVDGLSLGFILPSIFTFGWSQYDFTGTSVDFPEKWQYGAGNGWGKYINAANNRYHVTMADAFKLIRFGVKYAAGPVDAAFQFALNGASVISATPESAPGADDGSVVFDDDKVDSGLYFGLNFQINDQMKAGVGLEGNFNGLDSDANTFAFGVNFSYGDGPFSAGVEAGLYFGAKNGPNEKGILGLRPKISYNLVDNYLNLTLDAFLFFNFDSDVAEASGIGYEITPELSFNVMGTGAGQGYYWPNTTAIIVRYKVGGYTLQNKDPAKEPTFSALDITFKWSF